MPLRLDVKKKLSTRTDRVKSVDLHPTEPWVLVGLYTGHLQIWNYETQQLVKSFEVLDQTPIRFAKFITRKQWIVCGSDDMLVRVFNVNTMEKIREFEAHMDYIRSLEIHPVHPYVLTSSDDMQIKLWDWEKQWQNVQSFDGHSHYVMMVKFNPKDTNTFASASLDRSVKIWSLGSPLPNFSLEGHQAGVNCVDYFPQGDKPYLASGSDDHTVRIWDYQTKTCVFTLQSHTNNVSAVLFHPSLPIILSGSEDGTVRVWHSTTYRLESTLNYGMERCWAISGNATFSNKVACGFDEGLVVLQMGREMPVVSMDKSGKLLLATAKDIQQGRITFSEDKKIADGEVLEMSFKSACALENHLQTLEHNLNGRFVSAVGDGEYVIYTSQALRNKSFGQCMELGWSSRAANDYAIRDSSNKVKVYNDFKDGPAFQVPQAEKLFGGNLIGVATSDGSISFFSWSTGKEVVKIQVKPEAVYWSEEGDYVCLCCEESFFILQVDQDMLNEAIAKGEQCEKAFEYLDEFSEQVKAGEWIAGDCFVYVNSSHRLNYYVGGEITTIAHNDREHVLLGYLSNRVYLMNKQKQVSSYLLSETVLKYQTAVCRGNFALANEILSQIPRNFLGKIARFLEAKNFKEAALQVATDPEHKFELALQLEKFDLALDIMNKEMVPQSTSKEELEGKWKQLGDLALSKGNVALAEQCALNASDYTSLLLIYSSTGNRDRLLSLFAEALAAGQTNTAFCAAILVKDYPSAIEVLIKAQRFPEASFMALNFCPSKTSACVQLWKKEMIEAGHGLSLRIARALADPSERPELFPGFAEALANERPSSPRPAAAPLSAAVPKQVVAEPQQKRPLESPRPAVAEPPAKIELPRPVEQAPKVESPRPVEQAVKAVSPRPVEPAAVKVESPRPVDQATIDAADVKFAEETTEELIQDALKAAAVAPQQEEHGAEDEDDLDAQLDKEVGDDDIAIEEEDDAGAVGAGEEEDLALEEDWE